MTDSSPVDALGGPAPEDSEAMSPLRQWTALTVLLLAVLVIAMDNTVLGFAVPQLSADLAPSPSQLLWIVDAYAFVLAGLLITMGNLGDRVGRRRMLMIGAAGFAVTSAVAAFAPTAEALIAARALMGFFGAMLMPSALSLLRNIFVDEHKRRLAIGIWSASWAVGAALGPVVGGWLLEHAWWGSVFLMALPVMALVLIAGPILLPESKDDDAGSFDYLSSPLSLAAILPIVYALKLTAEHGPDLTALLFAAFGIGLMIVFVRRQQRLEDPMLDVSMFSRGAFTGAITSNVLCNFAQIGGVFIVAQYLQLVAGYEPLQAGLRLVPGMIAALVTSLAIVVPLRRGTPAWVLLAASLLTCGAGYTILATLSDHGSGLRVMAGMVLVGLGVGASGSLGTNLVVATAPAARAGSAAAVSETAFEFGGAIGIAVLGSTINAIYRRQLVLPEDLGAEPAHRAGESLANAAQVAAVHPGSTTDALMDSATAAFSSGMRGAAIVGAALLATGAVLVVWLYRNDRSIDLADVEH